MEENRFRIFRVGALLEYEERQISSRVPTGEVWIRILLAPVLCLIGGYFLNVMYFPLIFAITLSLANFQKGMGNFNLVFLLLNLALSYAVMFIGLCMFFVILGFSKYVLKVQVDGALWIYSLAVFVLTPLLLFRLYAYLFKYRIRSVGNLLMIAFCLILINSAFFTADDLRSDFITTWTSDDQTKFPYLIWLVACCLTMQLLIYSKHIRPDSSSK